MPEANESARTTDFWNTCPVKLLISATANDHTNPATKNPATKYGNTLPSFISMPAKIGPAAKANHAITVGDDMASPTPARKSRTEERLTTTALSTSRFFDWKLSLSILYVR